MPLRQYILWVPPNIFSQCKSKYQQNFQYQRRACSKSITASIAAIW